MDEKTKGHVVVDNHVFINVVYFASQACFFHVSRAALPEGCDRVSCVHTTLQGMFSDEASG